MDGELVETNLVIVYIDEHSRIIGESVEHYYNVWT